jgi:hypothetical protein
MGRDRGIAGDLRWAAAVLAGFALGALVFGAEASILVGALIGAVLVVAVRALLRRRRREAPP